MPDERVLFIHPYNHMEPDAVPVGSVGLVNGLPGKARGRFASEVTRAEIERAEVVLIDVHWFFPLAVLGGMLAPIRRLNRRAKIVVGGLSVSFYRDELFARFDVDYVLSGDVELSLAPLVAALLAGDAPPPLPGVTTRGPAGGAPERAERIDAAGFDAIDWLTIDWFPSYRDAMHEQHAIYRSRAGEAAPLCYPYLPVTRGCRRACDFCYGAYHERVFGRGLRMRSPAALSRDLDAIAADRALSFVSILFADEGLMAPYAPHLEGRARPLDAFVYFCGNADPDDVSRVRSGFAGLVNFSVIQPSDLAPLPSDPPPARRREAFAAMLRRFEQLDRTGVVFYRVHAPSEPELAAHGDPSGAIRADSGEDWAVIRPNATLLGPERSRLDQLDEVIAAARHATALHLARTLVPPLRAVLDPARYRDVDGELERDHARETDDDPIATRLRRAYGRGLREHRVYGFEALRLRFHAARAAASEHATWAPPGEALEGSCELALGLHGPGWAGEARLVGGECALVVCPVLLAWDAPAIDLATWPRTLLPSIPLDAGPARAVRVGGELEGRELVLWIEDGGRRVEHRLPHGLGLVETEALTRRAFPSGPEIAQDSPRTPWPSPSWPSRVLAALEQQGARALGGALRLRDTRVEATHLALDLRGDDGVRVAVAVFPRVAGDRYLGGRLLAFAYRVGGGSADLSSFHRALGATLSGLEPSLARDLT